MKLNYRDKMILTILIVALVWVLGIMLFIKPSIEGVQTAQRDLDSAKATLSDLEDRIDADKDLDARIATAYEEVNTLVSSFYVYQENQEATQLMEDLLDSDEIVNTNMTIGAYSAYNLQPYSASVEVATTPYDDIVIEYENQAQDPAATTEETTEADPNKVLPAPVTIGCYNLSFSFEAEKASDVISFCDKLQTSNTYKTLVIDSISLSFDETIDGSNYDTACTGSISLNMLVVRKLPDPSTF